MVTRNWSDNGRLNEIIEKSGDHGGILVAYVEHRNEIMEDDVKDGKSPIEDV